MNRVFSENDVVKEYNFEEPCPHCDTYVPIVIDENDRTCYEVTCPVCHNKIMLCTLCHWDAEDDGENPCIICDWNPVNGCFRKYNS